MRVDIYSAPKGDEVTRKKSHTRAGDFSERR